MTLSLSIHDLIERRGLIKRLGGRNRRHLSSSLRIKLRNGARILHRLANPRLLYLRKQIKMVDREGVYLKGGIVLKSPKLSRTLRHSEEIVCFITTIGGEVDSEINGMMRQGRLSEAFLIDALASVAIETVAEQFHRHMESDYRDEDKAVTLRFSPGYCDWPIEEQRTLFGLFGSNTAGIELKDSCLMMPRKSISAVFGAYPVNGDPTPCPYNPCIDCSKINCSARRSKGPGQKEVYQIGVTE